MKKSEVRRKQVLVSLVDEFLLNNEPVSSSKIAKDYIQTASPATIRIDLHKLEEMNLIYQPHTSAGRIPTINGYRQYLLDISSDISNSHFERADNLREILSNNFKDTSLTLHYIIQFMAQETEQLSFVAEPEIAYGYLRKLDVFKIEADKLLFVIGMASGIDKTMIINCEYNISNQQLKAIVRYLNDELAGKMLYDIQNNELKQMSKARAGENKILDQFLHELQNVFSEISTYFLHFDGNINFLEQPEFEKKKSILSFLSLTQRQDTLSKLMQMKGVGKDNYNIIMGEEWNKPEWSKFVLIYSKYYVFGIPGYLGVLSPVRMGYRKAIPIVRDIANTITNTTRKGMVVPTYEN